MEGEPRSSMRRVYCRTVSLHRHIAVLRSFASLIVLSVAISVVAAIGTTLLLPRVYEARAVVAVGQPLGTEALDYNDLLASQVLARTYARLVQTGPLLSSVISHYDLQMDPEALAKQVSTDVQTNDTLIAILVRDADPVAAARTANAIAQELVSRAPQTSAVNMSALIKEIASLDGTIKAITTQIQGLTAVGTPTADQLAQLDSLSRLLDTLIANRATLKGQLPTHSPSNLAVVDPATAPASPAGVGRTAIVLIAAVTALIVALALAYSITAWRAEGTAEAQASGATGVRVMSKL